MGRRGEKKIITWRYQKGGNTLDVPVYQVADGHSGGVTLRVNLPELDICVTNSDVNALQMEVFKLVGERLRLKWEWFLYIKINGSSYNIDYFVGGEVLNPHLRFDTAVAVSRVEVGTRPDGTRCYREAGHAGISEGLPHLGTEDGSKRSWGDNPVTYAMVPDTPGNRKALVTIGKALVRLDRELRKFLSPDTIHATLSAINRDGSVAGLPVLDGGVRGKPKTIPED